MKYITYGLNEYVGGFTLGFVFETEAEAKAEVDRLRSLKSEEPSYMTFEDLSFEENKAAYESGELTDDQIKEIAFEKFLKAKESWSEKFLIDGMSYDELFSYEEIKVRQTDAKIN